MQVEFALTGTTALLFHADDVMASDDLEAWRKDPANKNRSKAGDDRSPAWTWQTYLYQNHDGVIAWPSANLMVGLRQAGARIVMQKQRTFKEATQSGIVISSEYLDFRYGKNRQLAFADVDAFRDDPFTKHIEAARDLGFSLFVKRAKIGQAKHVRVRARFEPGWKIHGTLTVREPAITFDILKKILEISGDGGQGDWRPACKTPGPFGMYEAVLKKVG